jgi:peptidoglycan/xylan/chitin deacetylase (PgdA/CDA1 family)
MSTRSSIVSLGLIFGLAAPLLVRQAVAADPPPAPAGPGVAAGTTPKAASAASPEAPAAKPNKPVVNQSAQVAVFCYHRFVDSVRSPGTEIRPADFEAQMKLLKDRGITVIGMQDFLAWRRGEKDIPARSAIITFDDGWETQYTIGWPILKRYGYPLTLFVYTEGVRGGTLGGGGAITWEQLAAMRDAGVDIQSHSATHQDLREGHAVTLVVPGAKRTRKKLSGPEYEEWLHNEIVGCKELLEEKLAIKVNCYATPFGHSNDHVKQLARDAGYEALFTTFGKPLTFDSPLDALDRYAIDVSKPKIFQDVVKLIGGSGGASAAVAPVTPANLVTQPADGETIHTPQPLIKADLGGLGAVDPDTVEMRVSGLGVVTTSYDPKTDSVSHQVTQNLRDGACTVILSAKADGKRVESRWTFRVAKGGGAGTTRRK